LRRPSLSSATSFFVQGGAVLGHVGADPGFGLGVGGAFGAQAGGLRGLAVGHVSGEDQVGKGHFLIGDEVVDFVLRHGGLAFMVGFSGQKKIPPRRDLSKTLA
jgi:hypothetical protein